MNTNKLALIALAVLGWACNPDDDGGTLELEVPTGSIAETIGQSWIIVSDNAGKILDTAPLSNGTTYRFNAMGRSANVTFTLVRNTTWTIATAGGYRTYAGTEIDTYAGISHGRFTYPAATPIRPTPSQTATLRVQGWGPGGVYLPQPGAADVYATGEEVTIQARIAGPTAVLLTSGQAPFRYLYQEVVAGGNYTISGDDFATAETKSIDIPGAEGIYTQVAGTNALGEFPYYENIEYLEKDAANVPVPANLFSHFTTHVVFSMGDAQHEYATHGTEIPVRARTIAGSLDISLEGNTIRSASGANSETDVVSVSVPFYRTPTGNIAWRVFMAPGNQSVTPPVIPDDIPMGGLTGDSAPRGFLAMTGSNMQWVQRLLASSDHTDFRAYVANYMLRSGELVVPAEQLSKTEYHR